MNNPPPPHWKHAPPWASGRLHKRRFLLLRFIFMFLPMLLLFIAALGVILSIVIRPLNQMFPRPEMIILVICGIPAAFVASAFLVGGLIFRRFGTPLADLMSAADAVAEGDFSIRVREKGPGEFIQMARSFNRMTTELERAETRRRNLTADVAHELRSPLQVIQGNLEGILDGVYPADHEHISATLDETRLLSRLVSDLQTLSLAEAGQLPLHKVHVAAADLLEDALTSFSGQAAAAGIELSAQPVPEGPAADLFVDPDRIDQVLSNLIANALRHTPSGGKITLRARADAAGTILEVEDSGAGILPDDLPYIFDRFYRGDHARTRGTGSGSGLGLAIARQLVQAHEGQIRAENLPGSGALFTIQLPHPPPSTDSDQPA